jgi:hypothetical protein
LIENIQKALGRKPVRLGKPKEDGSFDEVYVYEGAAANAAIRLAGAEMSMFTERRDVTVKNEYAHLTDEQLAQKLVEIGQQVLLGSLEGPVSSMMGLGPIGDYLRPVPPTVGLDPGDIIGLDVAPATIPAATGKFRHAMSAAHLVCFASP